MSAKSNNPEGVIVGRMPSRFRPNRQILWKSAIAVIVLVGLVFGGRMYLQNRQRTAEVEFDVLTKSVNTLTFQKKYDEAVAELNDYIAKAPNQKYKSEAMAQLGSVYLNYGKFPEALSVFQEADKLGGTNKLSSAVGMALAAERLGDKAVAIDAYKKVIELLRPHINEGFVAQDIKQYEAKIQTLEGQQ